ncbi:MAG: hypothetical protein ACREOC_15085 [Gemmatimonadales bacterium]
MTSGLLSRLNALVLVALILSGGGGIPVLDALSHGFGSGYTAPHVEPAGPSDSHRDFCSLGASLPLSPHLSTLHLSIAAGVVSFPARAFYAPVPRSTDLGLLPQPRAPPSFSA